MDSEVVQKGLNRHCGTQRQLKENLYEEMEQLFSEGELYEKSIEVLRELAEVYEADYNYETLAEIMVFCIFINIF